jgi:hypothetical protein
MPVVVKSITKFISHPGCVWCVVSGNPGALRREVEAVFFALRERPTVLPLSLHTAPKMALHVTFIMALILIILISARLPPLRPEE